MAPSDSFTQLFNALKEKALCHKGELLRPWLHSSLFHTQSTRVLDYLEEAESNVSRLQQLESQMRVNDAPSKGMNEQHLWLSERVTKQLEAITRALYKAPPRVSESLEEIREAYKAPSANNPANQKPAGTANNIKKLYETLTQYKGYEQRLEDQLRLAQAKSHTDDTRAFVITTQQRLMRCQKAIVDIEKKIYRHEQAQMPVIDDDL